jgi:nitroimidazol reductase NimA-like FMN-containing flavoprotein (pyridoxamine 5'-phosphate oxidase superfamily)
MRRHDKEIESRKNIDEIIRGSLVCRLAMARDNVPYLVPLSFGYDGKAIYFHTAAGGRKIEHFEANPQVCFEFERHVEIRRDLQIACKWSFDFESVIGFGTIAELLSPEDKKFALNEIMRQYSGRSWSIEGDAISTIRAWKVTIATLTGKQSKPKEVVSR